MNAASGTSVWEASSDEPVPQTDPLPQAPIDVAIVGGGYTGLSTALHCAGKGLSAHVVEAEHVGFGGSGRNVGLVNAGVWHPPAAVHRALGPTYGPRFLEEFGQAPERVFSLIEQHQIRCAPTRTGTLHAAHAPSGLRNLRGRHAEWARLGAPVEMLDRTRMAELTGSRAFFGGLLDHRAGTLNPLAYCRGLARAARGAGAGITVGVRAQALRREGALWRIETPEGALRAKAIVLGTNAYTDTLWPGLARSLTTIDYFQLATEPLGAEILPILPGRQGLWDTGRIMLSLRRDAQDRLVIGSMGRVMGTAAHGISRRWAARQLARLFPSLGPVTFAEAWHGRIAMTPDHMPRIHNLAEGLYTPIGYNGRGVTSGTVFGAAMAELLSGADPDSLPLPVTQARPSPLGPLVSRAYAAAFAATQLWRGL